MSKIDSLFKDFATGAATVLSSKKDWNSIKRMSKSKNADVWQQVWVKEARPAAIKALEESDLGLTKAEITGLVDEYGESRKLPFIKQTTQTDLKRLKKLAQSKGDLEGDIQKAGISKPSRKALIEFEEEELAVGHSRLEAHDMMGFTTREWVTGGNKPCDVCLAKAGQVVGIRERYSGGEEIAHAHIHCECRDKFGNEDLVFNKYMMRGGKPGAHKPSTKKQVVAEQEKEKSGNLKMEKEDKLRASYRSKVEKELGIPFDTADIPAEDERAFGEMLKKYNKRFPGLIGVNGKFTSLKTVNEDEWEPARRVGAKGWLIASDNQSDYVINRQTYNNFDVDALEERDEKSGYHPETTNLKGSTIIHELGHSFGSYSMFGLSTPPSRASKDMYESIMDALTSGDDSKVSRYAETDYREAFAECFVAAEIGKPGKYTSVGAVKMLKKLIKETEQRAKSK